MRLTQISLVNWKGYRRAEIRFPDTDAQRNVVLVRGSNGAGKTSVMEAVALALYGRQGLDLVGRAISGERPDTSYDSFLERALNTAARGRAARMAASLVFTGGGAERVELERVWHFSGGGRHRRDDEEVRIRIGLDEELLPLPEGEAREDAIRDFVGRDLLPRNLASFFIFDGEHVERFAGRGLAAQVRAAAEIVLGAPELRSLAGDLRVYGRDRRRDARRFDDAGIQPLRQELTRLEREEQVLLRRVETDAAAIAPVRAERDELVRRIGSLHGDSYASFKALFEAREVLTRARADDQDQLRQALSVDLALALCGEPLRAVARQQLAAEALLDQWESGQASGDARRAAFVSQLEQDGGPPLNDDFIQRLARAWDAVWREPPQGCATVRRHSHLGEADRLLVQNYLEAVTVTAGDTIAEIARRVEVTDREVIALEDRIARQRGLDEQSQALADELRTVQERIAGLEAEHRADVQALDAIRGTLAPLRQELGRQLAGAAAAAPLLQKADRADAYAALLEDLIAESVPQSLETLAQDVGEAYRTMAHKNLVTSVRIIADGAVSLVDAFGRDVRERDASAGETQIFALALMAAIIGAAPVFPVLMDTPFARLDGQHRVNVMRQFANLGVPLFLFAHPSELSADETALLVERLAGVVQISNTVVDGEGIAQVANVPEAAHGV